MSRWEMKSRSRFLSVWPENPNCGLYRIHLFGKCRKYRKMIGSMIVLEIGS